MPVEVEFNPTITVGLNQELKVTFVINPHPPIILAGYRVTSAVVWASVAIKMYAMSNDTE